MARRGNVAALVRIGAQGMTEVAPAGRVTRRPQHSFQLRTEAWQIQPFLLAPVLPGETLKSLLIQSRCVTDPVLNPLIGWWKEYYVFYVKHRDLDARDTFTAMMLDPNYDVSAEHQSTSVYTYHKAAGINWAVQCLERVIDTYFRDEGETWDGFAINGIPVASVNDSSWLDSVINAADYYTAEDLDVDLDADATIMASEVEGAMRQWEFMKANVMTNMSYEDFLATYGVRPTSVDLHKPELIRYVREWTYPSNTVDPATGAPSSACSWAMAERADKDRFFPEPGFIFGVTVTRPKIYRQLQECSASWLLQDAFAWLPAVMRDDPSTSLRLTAQGAGPLAGNTDAGGYVTDTRDLFLYGDQFINFARTEVDGNLIGLPTAALQKRYPGNADADELWVDPTGPPAQNLIREDGIVSLNILGSIVDATP